MILAIKTDNPVMELYVLTAPGDVIDRKEVQLGNQMSREILSHIEALLRANQSALSNIIGIIVYKGPGSFTGLRIGLTVANTLAYAQQIPIVGTTGEAWLTEGVSKLEKTGSVSFVIPEYGGEANITKPRK